MKEPLSYPTTYDLQIEHCRVEYVEPPNPEVQKLKRQIAELQRQLADLDHN